MALDLPALLRAEGLEVLVHPGWRSNDRPGTFTPLGVMNHHTVSGAASGEFPSLGTVTDGRPGIPGPLCNLLVGRLQPGRALSRVYVIADGRANDSGIGCQSVLDRIRIGRPPAGDATSEGSTNGNPWFYDIEVENNGTGEPYPAGQIETVVRCNAAIAKAERWARDAHWAIHHREWTSRKVDMSWRGDLRGRIAAYLTDGGVSVAEDPMDHSELYRLIARGEIDGEPSPPHVQHSTAAIRGDTKALLNQVAALAAQLNLILETLKAIAGGAPPPPPWGTMAGTGEFTVTLAPTAEPAPAPE